MQNGTRVMFSYMGELLSGKIFGCQNDLYIITSGGKNYLIEPSKIVRRIF